MKLLGVCKDTESEVRRASECNSRRHFLPGWHLNNGSDSWSGHMGVLSKAFQGSIFQLGKIQTIIFCCLIYKNPSYQNQGHKGMFANKPKDFRENPRTLKSLERVIFLFLSTNIKLKSTSMVSKVKTATRLVCWELSQKWLTVDTPIVRRSWWCPIMSLWLILAWNKWK